MRARLMEQALQLALAVGQSPFDKDNQPFTGGGFGLGLALQPIGQ